MARLGQGLVIEVRSVDLDAMTELMHPHMVHEDHGQGIRLLAGRAARAPHPDGSVGPGIGHDSGDDFGSHESPRLGVAEETGDIDKDSVEEEVELFGMMLQVVLVPVVGGNAHGLQAPVDPPDEARPLVGGDVEAAGLLQVLEKILHPFTGVLLTIVRHARPVRMARTPIAPSLPEPLRTTAMARSLKLPAVDSKSRSADGRTK